MLSSPLKKFSTYLPFVVLFQISSLEQQLSESSERLKSAEQQITEKEQVTEKLVSETTSVE